MNNRPVTLAMPWWCAPAGIAAGFLLPLMFVIALAGDMNHPALTIRGVATLNHDWLLLGALMLVPLMLAGWFGAQLTPASTPVAASRATWDQAARLVGGIALFAFVVWFQDFLLNPLHLWETLTGAFKPDRQSIEVTIGVTSLANVAPVFFSLYAFRVVGADVTGRAATPVPRDLHMMFAALAALTLFRVYAWSERLSMIEMVVPFGLAIGSRLMTYRASAAAAVRTLGPYAALPFVVLFFGIAEYARSWSSDTYQGRSDFWEFALGRFASYYYTSLNNGASLLANTPWPTWQYEFVLDWLHKAPFGLGKLFDEWINYKGARFTWFLSVYQDEEFNSPSGLYGVIADLGLVGGTLYMLAVGLCSGLAFRAWREARLAGVLLYPLFFISFLELYRYPYLGTSRAFTWTLGIGLALGTAWLSGLGPARTDRPAPTPATKGS